MGISPADLAAALDERARARDMSGIVSIDVDGASVFARGYGLADRAHGIRNAPSTRFGVASVSKAFTAAVVWSLIDEGSLARDTPARALLRADLPLIEDTVTVEQLLTHTSGIGDYLDENAGWDVDDYVLPVPVHRLDRTEAFVDVVDGFAQTSAPGERYAYNNGGYVVLALIAERASGVGFHDLVQRRVFDPAGMAASAYLRLDELPGDAALGYLSEDPASLRINALHLPVRGGGDGGAYSTAADLSRFWHALTGGGILAPAVAAEMLRPRHVDEEEGLRAAAGVFADLDGPGLVLEGYDPGASVRTRFEPETRTTVTVASNTSEGAWDVVGLWAELIGS